MRIIIERIGLSQAPLVQRIFESSPEYFRRTDRSEVLPHFAAREILDTVPKERQKIGYEKVFCFITVDGNEIGIVDLHKNHPEQGKCYLGLLMIEGQKQNKGMGRSVFPSIEQFVSQELHCSEIVLGVSEDNDVEGFWQKLGFKRNGRTYVWKGEGHVNNVFEMTKLISNI